MIIVENWIKEEKESRIKHIDLSESCIERGGNSTVHRGVLAQYLNTNFPNKVDLCHACSNDKCSNPKHLYWGTRKENVQDMMNAGNYVSPFQKMVDRYGYDEACRLNSRKNLGNKNGSGNKGKNKSEEHKKNIANALKSKYNKLNK